MQTPHAPSDHSRSGTFDPDRFLTENDDDGFVAYCAASYAASPLRLLLNKSQDTSAVPLAGAAANPRAGGAGPVDAAAPVSSDSTAQAEPQSQSSSGASASQQSPISPTTPQTSRGVLILSPIVPPPVFLLVGGRAPLTAKACTGIYVRCMLHGVAQNIQLLATSLTCGPMQAVAFNLGGGPNTFRADGDRPCMHLCQRFITMQMWFLHHRRWQWQPQPPPQKQPCNL